MNLEAVERDAIVAALGTGLFGAQRLLRLRLTLLLLAEKIAGDGVHFFDALLGVLASGSLGRGRKGERGVGGGQGVHLLRLAQRSGCVADAFGG